MPRKPKKLKVKNPPETTKIGSAVALTVEGGYDAAVANRKTGVMLQIFYKASGFPLQDIIDRKVTHSGQNFSDAVAWTPTRLGTHSIRVLAWDITHKPENGKDHASHLIRIRVTKD
jgi:hypothetical protein